MSPDVFFVFLVDFQREGSIKKRTAYTQVWIHLRNNEIPGIFLVSVIKVVRNLNAHSSMYIPLREIAVIRLKIRSVTARKQDEYEAYNNT
jgi:hypothetical protein